MGEREKRRCGGGKGRGKRGERERKGGINQNPPPQ